MIKFTKPFQTSLILIILLTFLLAGCAAKPVDAPPKQVSRDPKGEQILEEQLKGMNPKAVPIYQEATKAMDSFDLEKATKLYQEVLVLAPDFSTAYRRLGYIELSRNNIDKAEELTRKALELEPNSFNQGALALILVQRNIPKDSQEAFDLATSAVVSLPDDGQANYALLVSALAVNKIDIARTANQHLIKLEPYNPLAHYFAGLLAAYDGKWEKAETELLYARDLGLDPKIVQDVLDKGITRNALLIRSARRGGIATVIWLVGLGLLFAAGTWLSRATMQALNRETPLSNIQIKPEEGRIRFIYRAVIAILSVYFYISIPFVIFILLLVVGGAFYIFFLIGTFPIQLSVVLVIMLVVSLFAILRSLFSRIKDVPPGRQLQRIDAPELWKLVEEVAGKLDTRPADVVYVTPWTGIAVNERGSILQKLRGTAKRNLILGMGVLPGLTQGQLAAILAHEYGHFSNRDTAGGNLAYQVYGSLAQIAEGLIRSRVALVYNPVWWFVMAYQRIYLRVTLGASRLQEVLADRYAAMAYGSQNFIDGLQSVIRQSIAFPLRADVEVRRSLELKQTVNNLYDLQMDENLQGELQKQLDDAMNRQTSQYDSHPAPRERIAWIERMHIPLSPVLDNRLPALNLFPNPEELQRTMTAELMKKVVKKS
jgi:Zn-dependent protease with chaperone function/tetratricopeptide (TPR) repeat protein